MPRNPDEYADLLGKKLDEHGTQVYLINTGWSGGPYGVGARMDIMLTRAMVSAAISGKLAKVKFKADPIFKVMVPTTCPGVKDSKVLWPKNTWKDKKGYDARAKQLAKEKPYFYWDCYLKKIKEKTEVNTPFAQKLRKQMIQLCYYQLGKKVLAARVPKMKYFCSVKKLYLTSIVMLGCTTLSACRPTPSVSASGSCW